MSEQEWVEKLETKPNYKLGQNFLIDSGLISEAMPIDKVAIDVTE